MSIKPPTFIEGTNVSEIPQDKLDRIREKASEARNLERLISDTENDLKAFKSELQDILYKQLPDLLDEAGLDRIGLPEDGEFPAVDARLSPYYSANIAAGWNAERRQAAFDWLEAHGHGDLIKTQVTVPFAREDRDRVEAFKTLLSQEGLSAEIKENVHPQTLTAWLREQVESGHPLPPLETLGATVGRVVKLKDRNK